MKPSTPSNLLMVALLVMIWALGCKLPDNSNTQVSTGRAANSPSSTASTPAATPQRPEVNGMPVYKTGEQVAVGYMSYQVFDAKYTSKLSGNQFLNQPPDATYLFVDLGVSNTDKEERTIPPFKLIDEAGAEYGTSDKAWAAEGSIGLLSNLNPGVAKRANVIFDVPTNHQYKLKVSGGYWSADSALIELSPKASKK